MSLRPVWAKIGLKNQKQREQETNNSVMNQYRKPGQGTPQFYSTCLASARLHHYQPQMGAGQWYTDRKQVPGQVWWQECWSPPGLHSKIPPPPPKKGK